jgi:hypothetical protein
MPRIIQDNWNSSRNSKADLLRRFIIQSFKFPFSNYAGYKISNRRMVLNTELTGIGKEEDMTIPAFFKTLRKTTENQTLY